MIDLLQWRLKRQREWFANLRELQFSVETSVELDVYGKAMQGLNIAEANVSVPPVSLGMTYNAMKSCMDMSVPKFHLLSRI